MQKLTDLFEKKKYPDSSFYAKLRTNIETRIGSKLDLITSIQSYDDLFFLAQCKDILDNIGISTNLFITHLLEQQADRRFDSYDSFGLKIVCNFINNLNFDKLIIYHPHSDVAPALLNKCFVKDNSEFIKQVLTKIDTDNLILMSTDAGGFKPLMSLVDKIDWKGDTYSATKSRQYINNESKLIQIVDKLDFGGKDVILIDDLCLYGGTFLGLAKLLQSRNVGKLYLAISHVTVRNPNKELETNFDTIFTTNSKFDSYDLSNLKIINLF